MRYIAAAILLCVVTACDSSTEVEEPEPQIVENTVTNIIDIDNRGRILLTVRPDSSNRDYAAIWENNTITLLAYPPGGDLVDVLDMNEAGDVLGIVRFSDNRGALYVLKSGMQQGTVIESPSGYLYYPSAINDAGIVVGTAFDRSNNEERVPFTWSLATGFQLLDPFGSRFAGAYDINASGQVIGFYSLGNAIYIKGFIWTPDSGMRDLGNVNDGEVLAHAINRDGVITGLATDDGYYAFRWSASAGIETIALSSRASCAFDINDSGMLVGQTDVAVGSTRAFAWTPADGMTLIGSANNSRATRVNNRGDVIGYVDNFPTVEFFRWSKADGLVTIAKTRLDLAGIPRRAARVASQSLPC